MLVTILFLLLVLGGAAAATGLYVHARRKALPGGGARALPAGGVAALERTIRDLRVGDVLTLDGRDFLVEGTIGYDEDGHRWTGGRIVDGKDVRWLVIGIERVGATPLRILGVDGEADLSGYPPEVMVVGEQRYALDKRGTATCKLTGDLGTMTAGKPKADPSGPGTVERCRWWLYNAAGDDTLIVEQWGNDYRVMRGKKVAPDTVDLIPGS